MCPAEDVKGAEGHIAVQLSEQNLSLTKALSPLKERLASVRSWDRQFGKKGMTAPKKFLKPMEALTCSDWNVCQQFHSHTAQCLGTFLIIMQHFIQVHES